MFINFVQRLQAEVVAWHKLCHRNVSQLIGVVQFDDSIGMVSPWCDNGTISHYLKNHSQANRMSLVSLDIFLTLNSILIGQTDHTDSIGYCLPSRFRTSHHTW